MRTEKTNVAPERGHCKQRKKSSISLEVAWDKTMAEGPREEIPQAWPEKNEKTCKVNKKSKIVAMTVVVTMAFLSISSACVYFLATSTESQQCK